jgi:hypothetical protein
LEWHSSAPPRDFVDQIAGCLKHSAARSIEDHFVIPFSSIISAAGTGFPEVIPVIGVLSGHRG